MTDGMHVLRWELPVKPIAGAVHEEPRAVLKALFDRLADDAEELNHTAYSTFVLDEYCIDQRDASLQAFDARGDGQLVLLFAGGASGKPLICNHALYHWMRWAFAMKQSEYAKLLAEVGYTCGPDVSLRTLLRRGPELPLVHFEHRVFGVPRRRGLAPLADDAILVEETVSRVDWPPLSAYYPNEQRTIQAVAVTGRCGCDVCTTAIDELADSGLKDDGEDEEALPLVWTKLHEDAELSAMAREAERAVAAYSDDDWLTGPDGPAPLRVLRSRVARDITEVSTLSLTRLLLNLAPPAG